MRGWFEVVPGSSKRNVQGLMMEVATVSKKQIRLNPFVRDETKEQRALYLEFISHRSVVTYLRTVDNGDWIFVVSESCLKHFVIKCRMQVVDLSQYRTL